MEERPASQQPPEFGSFALLARVLDDLPQYLRLPSSGSVSEALEGPLQWFLNIYRTDYPNESTLDLIRLLCPQEDVARKFGLAETLLAKFLVSIYRLPAAEEARIKGWRKGPEHHGDLSSVVCMVLGQLEKRGFRTRNRGHSIAEVNRLLDLLASHCRFSDDGTGKPPVKCEAIKQVEILRSLFCPASAREAKWLTRIILKDLFFTFKEPHARPIFEAVHPLMWKIYQVRTSLASTCAAVDEMCAAGVISKTANPNGWSRWRYPDPILGCCVSIMECEQARSITHFINAAERGGFSGSFLAEVKEDGERMQIHIDLSKPRDRQITIFSKSRRNSTYDREPVHHAIRAALGLGPVGRRPASAHDPFRARSSKMPERPIKKNIVIEAELLIFNTDKGHVEEFSVIRDYQRSGAKKDARLHLCAAFFDVLFVDDVNLMGRPLVERRKVLETVVVSIPGHAWVVEGKEFSLSRKGGELLAKYFVELLTRGKEGLVLKPLQSKYKPGKFVGHGWFKLKRDYIEGFSRFEKDFPVVAASFGERSGARVDPQTKKPLLAVFWIACMRNKEDYLRAPDRIRPELFVLQPVSFGFSIEDLVLLNAMYRRWAIPVERVEPQDLQYDLTNTVKGRIDYVFTRPFVVEILGSDEGFHREDGNNFYTVRFPRVKKLRKDILWTDEDCLGFSELQSLARKSKDPMPDTDRDERKRLRKLLASLERQHQMDGTLAPRQGGRRAELDSSSFDSSSQASSFESLKKNIHADPNDEELENSPRDTSSLPTPSPAKRRRVDDGKEHSQSDGGQSIPPEAAKSIIDPAPEPTSRADGTIIVLSSPLESRQTTPTKLNADAENVRRNCLGNGGGRDEEGRLRLPFLSPGSESTATRRNSPIKSLGEQLIKTPDNISAKFQAVFGSPSFYLHREANSFPERPEQQEVSGRSPLLPQPSLRPSMLKDFQNAYFFAPSTIRYVTPLKIVPTSSSGAMPGTPLKPEHVRKMLDAPGSYKLTTNAVWTLDSLVRACGWIGAEASVDDRIGVVVVDREHDASLLDELQTKLAGLVAKIPCTMHPPYPSPVIVFDWHILEHVEDLQAESHTTEDRHDEMLELCDKFLIAEYRPAINWIW